MTKGLSTPLGVGRADPAPTASSRGAALSQRTVREPRAGLVERLEGRRERRHTPLLSDVSLPSGGEAACPCGSSGPSPYTEMLN